MVKDGLGIAGHDLSIGADILRRAALSDAFAAASGRYFDNDGGDVAEPHPAARDGALVAEIMAAIRDLAGKGAPA